MKNIKLDKYGDAVIEDNNLRYVFDIELLEQTIRQVLGTNLGEWLGDTAEGIDFSVILTKNPNHDLIQDSIDTAVQSVASNYGIELNTDDFSFVVTGRAMTISFKLSSGSQSKEIVMTL